MLKLEEIKTRLLNGETKTAIAKSLGVHRTVLSFWLGDLKRKPITGKPKSQLYWRNQHELNGDHTVMLVWQADTTRVWAVLLDNDDVPRIKKHLWRIDKSGYAVTSMNGETCQLTRFLKAAQPGFRVSLKNGNKLDNRKENLLLRSVDNGLAAAFTRIDELKRNVQPYLQCPFKADGVIFGIPFSYDEDKDDRILLAINNLVRSGVLVPGQVAMVQEHEGMLTVYSSPPLEGYQEFDVAGDVWTLDQWVLCDQGWRRGM